LALPCDSPFVRGSWLTRVASSAGSSIGEETILKLFTTVQKFILNIVMMLMDLTERGGHALRGVTAHGSPGGPLQFDRLEAALATAFH